MSGYVWGWCAFADRHRPRLSSYVVIALVAILAAKAGGVFSAFAAVLVVLVLAHRDFRDS